MALPFPSDDEELRAIIAIDFGTTRSGVAFIFKDDRPSVVCRQGLNWRSNVESENGLDSLTKKALGGRISTSNKNFTYLLVNKSDSNGHIFELVKKSNKSLWGIDALIEYFNHSTKLVNAGYCKWEFIYSHDGFKSKCGIDLSPNPKSEQTSESETDKQQNIIKTPQDIVRESLKCLVIEAKEELNTHIKNLDKRPITDFDKHVCWVVSIPVRWTDVPSQSTEGREIMMNLAEKAGMKKILLVTEPEAAAYSFLNHDDQKSSSGLTLPKDIVNNEATVKEGEVVLFADIGGGSCDFVAMEYKSNQFVILTEPDNITIGATDVDDKFEYLLTEINNEWWKYVKESLSPQRQIALSYFEVIKVGFDPKDKNINNILFRKECSKKLLEIVKGKADIQKKVQETLDANHLFFTFEINGKSKKVRFYNNSNDHEEDDLFIDIDNISPDEVNLRFNLGAKTISKFFNHSIEKIEGEIQAQITKIEQKGRECNHLFMMGGYSNSKFLQQRVKEKFKSSNPTFRDQDCCAVLRGAINYVVECYSDKELYVKVLFENPNFSALVDVGTVVFCASAGAIPCLLGLGLTSLMRPSTLIADKKGDIFIKNKEFVYSNWEKEFKFESTNSNNTVATIEIIDRNKNLLKKRYTVKISENKVILKFTLSDKNTVKLSIYDSKKEEKDKKQVENIIIMKEDDTNIKIK